MLLPIGAAKDVRFWLEMLKEPVVLLFAVSLGIGFLVICYILFFREAPRPSGDDSEELRDLMLAAARSLWFRLKSSLWSRLLPWRRRFDRESFLEQLELAEYKEFKSTWQALGSLGWSGWNHSNIDPKWLFGVPVFLRRLWVIGRSIIGHELLHAAQDNSSNYLLFRPLLRRPIWQRPLTVFLVELEAHVFGGPLVAGIWSIFSIGLAVGLGMLFEVDLISLILGRS